MTEQTKSRRLKWDGPLVLLGNGLLLACTLAGFLLSFLSLYADPGRLAVSSVRPSALDLLFLAHNTAQLTALSLLLALLSLAVWSLPRFRAPALGVLAAGWAGLVWLFRHDVWNGALLTVKAVADLFEDRVGWFGPMTLDLDLTAAEELAATERFLFCAVFLLALLLGWAIVRARRWWMVLFLTLPPLLPGLLADVYPSWPTFMALAVCWCTMLLTSLCKWAAPSGRGRLTLAVLPAVGALLALLTVLLPMEGYTRPQWTYTAENALVNFGNRHLFFLSDWNGPFTSRVTYVGSAETVNLADAGPLRYTGRTVLKVTSDYTGRVCLRGSSLANYTGTSWEPLDGSLYREYTSAMEESGVESVVSPLLFPAASWPDARQYTITIENTGASGSCVYAPYHLADQDWAGAGLLVVDDVYLARQRDQWTHTLAFVPRALDLDEFYDGSISHADKYGDYARDHYLDVPEELRELLNELLRSNDRIQKLDLADKYVPGRSYLYATAVADLLDDLCKYDPNTPVVPDGEDFVEYFLTESHRGYCMHFASAATLMLRSRGIPARYVSGFNADLQARETVNVPDSAAHAWVEIYLDGYGWYPVEVTPSYTPPTDEPVASPSAVPSELPNRLPSETEEPEPAETPSPSPSASQPIRQELPQSPGLFARLLRAAFQVLKWVFLAAALCALVWLGQHLPKRWRAGRLAAPDTNRAALDGYRYLTRLKKWGGNVPEDALELARKARFSQHTLTGEEHQTMADIFNGERSRLSQTLPPVKRLIFRYLWGRPHTEEKEASGYDHP